MPAHAATVLSITPLIVSAAGLVLAALSLCWLVLRLLRVKRPAGVSIAWFLALLATLVALALQDRQIPNAGARIPPPASPARGRVPPDAWAGTVTRVSDGDTLVVRSDGGEVRVRLWAVDAPEGSQPSGPQARDYLGRLVQGRQVYVWQRDRDRYGRVVALLYTETGQCVNERLLAEGWVWWYREYAPKDAVAQALEADARKARRGLWARSSPTPPWEYRKALRLGRQTASHSTPRGGSYGGANGRTSGSR